MAIVLRIAGFWGFFADLFVSALADDPGPLFRFLGIALLVSALVFSYIHHVLFGNSPPEWPRGLPSPRSLWEGFYAPTVMLLSSLAIIIIFVPFLPLDSCFYQNPKQLNYCMQMRQAEFANYQFWLTHIGPAIWWLCAAYLYQVEFLVRRHLTRQFKPAIHRQASKKPADTTDIELDRLRGEMGLARVKKGKANPPQTAKPAPSYSQKLPKVSKIALVSLLVMLGVAGSWGLAKLPEIRQAISVPAASPPPAGTPSPQPDAFRKAVNKATIAAQLTQSAKSKLDWNLVAGQWREAIALMEAVPASSPNYALAQKKAGEYQSNLEYAQKAAGTRPQ
jgi:hypothetical protein